MNSVARTVVEEQDSKPAIPVVIPGHRLQLAYNPQQNATATPWVGLRYDGGLSGEIVTERFREPIEAADELLDLSGRTGLPVVMPAWLRDSLTAQWQQRGIALYRQGVGREWCTNVYVRQGWDAARAYEWQLALFGWPELAA